MALADLITEIVSEAIGLTTYQKFDRLTAAITKLPKGHDVHITDSEAGERITPETLALSLYRNTFHQAVWKVLGFSVSLTSTYCLATKQLSGMEIALLSGLSATGGSIYCVGLWLGLATNKQIDRLTDTVNTYLLKQKEARSNVHSIEDYLPPKEA